MNAIPRFTIVLSGYQTEPYLERALESIRGQTFADFDAVCYVEESTDRSLEICQAYARKDPRFQVVSAPKSGAVASTRNYAVDHARGEYLVVLDGDDWLSVHLLEKLDRKLRENGTLDVLAFAAVTTEDETADLSRAPRLTNFRAADAEGVFSGLEALRRAGQRGGEFRSYTWLCAYRTAFLREHCFYQTAGRLMEDFEWTPRVWFAAERFAYLDEVFYVYRRRANSLTTEASSRLLFDLIQQVRSLLEFADKTRIPDDLMRIWSAQWLSTLFWFLFHPVTSRKIPDCDRRKALEQLFDSAGKSRIRRLALFASRPKRFAIPLLSLAAKGVVLPAKLYFRLLYYPLSAKRFHRGKNIKGDPAGSK